MAFDVVIQRAGNLIRVTPGCRDLLASHLSYDRRQQQGSSGANAIYTPTYLFREENGSLIVPAGMTRRVVDLLTSANAKIRYEDLRTERLADPVFENLDPLREGQEDVIATIVGNDICQIEAPTGFGKSFVIRQICKLWPTARIIITSPYSGIIRQTYAELKELYAPYEVGMIGDGKSDTGRRITCALTQSLIKCDLVNCDIFLFDEVHRACAAKSAELIAMVPNARMYGFSASPTGRSDNADKETEAMFGPILAKLSYQEVQKTGSIVPMDVYVMPCRQLPPVTCPSHVINRWGVWRNEARNEAVKEAVDWMFKTFGADTQVMVTVNKVEHAVYLGQLLPNFALVYGQMDGDKRLRWERDGMIPKNVHPITSEVREQMRVDFRAGKLRRVIATSVWGTGIDFPLLQAVVRADASSGGIDDTQLPGRATRRTDGKEFGVVIEFDDAFHTTLNGRYKRRVAVYRKKGWGIHFIKTVPEYLTV